MIDAATLKQVFQDKLAKTGSIDQAFLKAIWVAYCQGLADAAVPQKPEPTTAQPEIL